MEMCMKVNSLRTNSMDRDVIDGLMECHMKERSAKAGSMELPS